MLNVSKQVKFYLAYTSLKNIFLKLGKLETLVLQFYWNMPPREFNVIVMRLLPYVREFPVCI